MMKITTKPFLIGNGYNEKTKYTKDLWHIAYEDEKGYMKDKMVSCEFLFDLYLKTRATESEDKEEAFFCYCNHTQFCNCGDPSINLFEMHLKAGNISFDKNNGWS